MLPVFSTIRRFRFHAIPSCTPPPLSYVHVDDLVRLLTRCAAGAPRLPATADCDHLGQGVYFATMEEHPDYAELGKIIRSLVDRPHAPMVYVPPALAYPIAAVNQSIARLRGRCDTFNVDKIREATVSSWACSGKAACRDLNTCISATLEQRISQTVDWYRSAGWL
jgi:nucleoside-diphosphate-sugar epimerase